MGPVRNRRQILANIEWPRGVDESLDVLATWPDATLVAGGTDLMVEINFQRLRPERPRESVGCRRPS
ncbi:MAG: hypothetical protein ACE5KX_00045 [Acidimicrobiia bacterium]